MVTQERTREAEPAGTPSPSSRASGARSRTRARVWLVAEVLAVLAIDVAVLRAVGGFFGEGTWFVGAAMIVLLVGVNVLVALRRWLVPWRWLAPGLALLVLLTVAPVAYTVYIAFTNYDADHILTRTQAVRVLEDKTFLPPGSETYRWAAYTGDGGEVALWLQPESGESLFVRPGESPEPAAPGEDGVAAAGADGFPAAIDGFTRLSRPATVARLTDLSARTFGTGADAVRITSLDQAGRYLQRYVYDDDTGRITDRQDDTEFTARDGTFTSADGTELSPSYQAPVGLDNVRDLFGDAEIRGPVLKIFAWTVAFALIVVGVQFAIGLSLALALHDRIVPRRVAKAVRSLLLLPYIVPGYLSILVWGALTNQNIGVVPLALERLTGLDPGWVNSPTGAKIVVLLVAFWLGFPYFLLICSGALQAVPAELTEAAEVDGAGPVMRFRRVVFPLLLRMVAPLIVLGLAFNFNNFMVVYLLTRGGPAMTGTSTPAGETDLLISYTYKLAFDFQQNDYALAALITMLIFVILLPVVVSQFRYYQVWSEED